MKELRCNYNKMKNSLFRGMQEQEVSKLLQFLGAREIRYEKNSYIFHTGEVITAMGLVLAGSVYIVKEDFWGNRNILAQIGTGEFFAETYGCLAQAPSSVSVVAAEDVSILFLHVRKAFEQDDDAGPVPMLLMRNLLEELAAKNLMLTQKIEHISQRTLRKKILSYLSEQSAKAGSSRFEIPFNRQQLADYLSVDRSALSAELGRLREEGIITFHKNRFRLLQGEE